MSRIAESAYGDTPAPGWKEPTTSRAAAMAMSGRAPHLRDEVLRVVSDAGDAGLTADEAAKLLGKTPFAIRPRLTELGPKYMKKLRPNGARRKNDSGHSAIVWVRTEGVTP